MAAVGILTRIPKKLNKTITFTNTAGNGAVGTVLVGTITGMIWITKLAIQCLTTLTSGGSATLALGTAGNTSGIIGATAYTVLTNTTNVPILWNSTSGATGVTSTVLSNIQTNLNLIITIAVSGVTAGVLEFDYEWVAMSASGQIQ